MEFSSVENQLFLLDQAFNELSADAQARLSGIFSAALVRQPGVGFSQEDLTWLEPELLGTLGTEDGLNRLAGSFDSDVIFGSADGDLLRGDGNSSLPGDASGGSDLLLGGGGDDRIGGKGGNDWVMGGSGDDELWGGLGDDLLYGGSGRNLLYGDVASVGQGHDTFVIGRGGTAVISDFGWGDDRLVVLGETSTDGLTLATTGNDTLIRLDGETLAVLKNYTGLTIGDIGVYAPTQGDTEPALPSAEAPLGGAGLQDTATSADTEAVPPAGLYPLAAVLQTLSGQVVSDLAALPEPENLQLQITGLLDSSEAGYGISLPLVDLTAGTSLPVGGTGIPLETGLATLGLLSLSLGGPSADRLETGEDHSRAGLALPTPAAGRTYPRPSGLGFTFELPYLEYLAALFLGHDA